MLRYGWLILLCGAAFAAEPPALQEPVNVVYESGKDVGPCAGGAELGYPPKPFKGLAYFLPKTDEGFRAAHEKATRGEAEWVKHLLGPSSPNRLYKDGLGNEILVFWICKQHACGTYSLAGAYDLRTHIYGAEITEVGRKRGLGTLEGPLRAAVTCAVSYDDKLRAEAERDLRRGPGGAK